ncbi:MAG: hypothetical protein IT361_04045 [Gemmatimonadaceae bacterium]|nr:hypothetical protein [Gemmatimonadaceae bacterium]
MFWTFRRVSWWAAGAVAVLATVAPGAANAQTDYYNLDAGRPLRVEDALVIERHALEWQVAPLRFSGIRWRGTGLAVEPELAWGALPRTQVEIGVPVVRGAGPGHVIGAAGVDVSVLHALNAETITWPALAISLGALTPAGPYGPDRTLATVGAIATRTLRAGRIHVNVAATPGSASGRVPDEASRWRVGIAGDRTFVVQSTLVGADLVAERPLGGGDVQWSAALGMRRQLGPRSAIDLGMGRRITGEGEWFVTAGSALSFGLLHRFGGVK